MDIEIKETKEINKEKIIKLYKANKWSSKVIPKELIDKSQMWFWTKEHQKAEEEAELELRQGKGKEVKKIY